MTNHLEEQRQNLQAGMDEQNVQEPRHTWQELETGIPGSEATEEMQDIYVLIIREREEEEENEAQVVESTLALPRKPSLLPAYAICCSYLLLIASTLTFQLSCLFNPPVAIVTIIPTSQLVTLSGTVQLGRLINPITISQSQTTATTGKGHQDARSATGYLTFYNGQFQRVTIAAGTVLTGASGIQVVTDQDAMIPAGNPPSYGQVSVSAHAVSPGGKGNIPAYDINQACCASSVLAKNVQPFTGGQDEREFQTVAQSDIATTATPLETAVTQSVNGALQGQLQPQEQVFILPCRPSVISDHQIGQEAKQVIVTVSQTCSAVAYSSQDLETKATAFLSTQVLQKPGTEYSLFGTAHVSVKQATISHSSNVFLSFSASGTWVYGLSKPAQAQIKHLIAGKTTQQALQLLATLPGVQQVAIRFTGFGDATRLPKQSSLIYLAFIVI